MEEHLAQRRHVVYVDVAFEVVVLMLDYARLDAGELLFVLHKIFIHIAQTDTVRTHYVFIDAR